MDFEKGFDIARQLKTNASQGPEIVEPPFSFVLHHSTEESGEENIHSKCLLDAHCGCGYESHGMCKGKMYFVKHEPGRRRGDFRDQGTMSFAEKCRLHDTYEDCSQEDVVRVQRHIEDAKRAQWFYRLGWVGQILWWFLGIVNF